ncbi:Mrp-4p [Sorochytrium milnesiophthora]
MSLRPSGDFISSTGRLGISVNGRLQLSSVKRQRFAIFDEAAGAIVQHTIRSEFRDCTVLTIAHCIATIMDSDRILVLDQGQVAEFDTPQALLQNPDSAFAKLVRSSGCQ